MIIYCENITSRIAYTINYVFTHRLGIAHTLTDNQETFRESVEPKLNYSSINFENSFHILPEGLLAENFIRKDYPEFIYNNNKVIFYPNASRLGFDIFSACFWMLSRMEEYNAYTSDAFGRFPATESFAYKNNFLNQPIVDQWILLLKEQLKAYFEPIEFKTEQYRVVPTIDIDSPWCYKHKGFLRNIAGLARDIMYVNFDEFKFRIAVLFGKINDPWFQFDWVETLFTKLKLAPIYFIHMGDYGKFDKTIKPSKKVFKDFVKTLGEKNTIGLHPSFQASKNIKILNRELLRFESITGNKPERSRQHFLNIKIPEYYERLHELGVKNDYTMGFADKPGFRSGTSRSFIFYNLINEQCESLIIHPFCIMDRTLKTYEQNSIDEVFQLFEEFALSLKKVNGTFISLWHNEALSDHFEWKGWKILFEKIMTQITR